MAVNVVSTGFGAGFWITAQLRDFGRIRTKTCLDTRESVGTLR